MPVITRLAPSPTGFMHIGTAKIALYNWLYARQHGGRFALRIEDTDRSEGRYFPEAVEVIYNELRWLGLEWDELVPSQFARGARHAEVARELLAQGAAYECYLSPAETEALREESRKTGKPVRSPYRDPAYPKPEGVVPALRLCMPESGTTVVHDIIQGDITIANETLEDLVILRSDGTPTYNLSVVVDDHDMEITHVIRGADHINNTPKQIQIYRAMGWEAPAFAHIPLILAMDGSKMSKRHGGATTAEYRDAGYLPEALLNFLIRLGWAHGDKEIFSRKEMLALWRLEDALKAPAKFDGKKLLELNAIYIRSASDARLSELLMPFMGELSEADRVRVARGVPFMKERAKTLLEMAAMARVYLVDSWARGEMDEKALRAASGFSHYGEVAGDLRALPDWNASVINDYFKSKSDAFGMKIGEFAAAMRAAIAGASVSPPLAEAMEIIGREESVRRTRELSK
ncbi:MAG: glutamate--tRNA ligase [Rickettsiales bacterium]|nr:glutamate--tRNA ligase [Rickettsiales bacterium]